MKKRFHIVTVFAILLFSGCTAIATQAVIDPMQIKPKVSKAKVILAGLLKAESALCAMDSSALATLYKDAVGIALTAEGLGPGYAMALPAIDEVVAGVCGMQATQATQANH